MRYATGSRNMQIYSARNPARYVFISAEGPAVLFECGGCLHLADELLGLTLTEARPATAVSYYFSGNVLPYADRWADEIAELMKSAPTKRIGLESATADAAFALQKRGFQVVGRYGYYTDFSRTFFCGTGRASDEARKLFRISREQVRHNVDVIRPGMSFREFAEKAWDIPEPYRAHGYFRTAWA